MQTAPRRSLLLGLALALAACQSRPASAPTAEPLPTPGAVPDGPAVLFYSDRQPAGWYLMQPDGSHPQHLSFPQLSGYTVNGLHWFPDLKLFGAILEENTARQEDYFLIDLSGRIVRQLTSDPYGESDLSYSAQAGKLLFVCIVSDLDLCTLNPDGSNYANLTLYPSREGQPSWSPNGRLILYVSNRNAVPAVWVMNADGSEAHLLNPEVQTPEGSPAWSPDGRQIAFDSQRDQQWEIYVAGVDGRGARNLTNNPASDIEPQWAPDGSRIAFRSDRDGQYDLYVMAADGSGPVNLTRTPEYDETTFTWTSDGQRLIYESAGNGGAVDVFAVNVDGSGRVNLTDNPAADVAPSWITP